MALRSHHPQFDLSHQQPFHPARHPRPRSAGLVTLALGTAGRRGSERRRRGAAFLAWAAPNPPDHPGTAAIAALLAPLGISYRPDLRPPWSCWGARWPGPLEGCCWFDAALFVVVLARWRAGERSEVLSTTAIAHAIVMAPEGGARLVTVAILAGLAVLVDGSSRV
jgi:hypothetical protein